MGQLWSHRETANINGDEMATNAERDRATPGALGATWNGHSQNTPQIWGYLQEPPQHGQREAELPLAVVGGKSRCTVQTWSSQLGTTAICRAEHKAALSCKAEDSKGTPKVLEAFIEWGPQSKIWAPSVLRDHILTPAGEA